MGLFANLKTATYAKGGTYMTPNCTYTLKLKQLEQNEVFGGTNNFIGTFEVLETDSTEHKIGSEVSYYVGDKGDSKLNFLGNVKRLLVALCGTMAGAPVDPSEIGEAEYLELMKPKAVGSLPGTAAEGVIVKVKTRGVKTKKAQPFTVHDFSPNL